MSDIRRWLDEQGLGKYTELFVENEIDLDVLDELTPEELEKLAIPLGARKRILKAIAVLTQESRTLPSETLASSGPAPSPAGEAERRQLTVMFADLVGSTELSQRLDPEELREVNRAYQDAAKAAIEEFEGYVARYMGDGVLAYFGYPQAHEDDAERGVRAGLRLIEAVPGASTVWDLAVRVGIATGLVVVGDLIGEGASQESAVVGETPNLAARLQVLAEPNTVLLTEATRRLVEGRFDLHSLGPQSLRGMQGPVDVFRADGVRGGSRFALATKTGLSQMVGRSEELGMLLRRWTLACEGEGQVLMLGGEPGIGKSRITEALRREVAAGPHTVLRYQCSPYHTTSTFYPVVEQLTAAARFRPGDDEAAKLDKLEALCGADAGAKGYALVAELLSLSTSRYAVPEMPPALKRAETIAALVQQLEMLARAAPVLMIFEDVHWIDASTRELLERTVESIPSVPVLLVITHRPEFTSEWLGRGHVTHLGLNRLGRGDVREVVSSITEGKALPDKVLEHIHRKTDGVPLFVEELTRDLLESELLEEGPDAYQLTGSLASLSIPSTVHDALTARLDRLGRAKQTAQIGSVLGRTFPLRLLTRLSERPEAELNKELTALIDAELLTRHGVPPETTYTFRHALVRDAAYDSLLVSARRRVHAGVAATLLEEGGDTVDYAVVANHLELAGEYEDAVSNFVRAGRRAAGAAAHDEASRNLERALAMSAGELEGESALRAQLDIQLALGVAHLSRSSYADPEVGEAYRSAAQLAASLNDDRAEFAARRGEWMHLFTSASPDYGLAKTQDMLEMGSRLERRDLEVVSHQLRGQSLYLLGRSLEAKGCFERAVSLAESIREMRYGRDAIVFAHTFGAQAQFAAGYPDRAVAWCEKGLRLAAETGNGFVIGQARSHSVATLANVFGKTETRKFLLETKAQAEGAVFGYFEPLAQLYLAWSDPSGDGNAVAQARAAVDALMKLGATVAHSNHLTLQAQCELASGMRDDAIRTTDASVEFAEAHHERIFLPEALRVSAEVRLAAPEGNESDAEQLLRRAIDTSREMGAKGYELPAAVDLARLLSRRGDRAAARAVLEPIYGWFTEGFDTLHLTQARALLNELP